MHKKERKTPEEIARDLEEVTLPEIEDGDLEDALGGTIIDVPTENFECPPGC